MAFAFRPCRPSMIDVRTRVVPTIAGSSWVPDTTRRYPGAAHHITGHIRSGLSETAQDLRSFALTQIVKDAVEPHCMEQRRGIADILDGCIRTAADVRPS